MTERLFRPIHGSLVVGTACGFLLVVYLIVANGAADVVHSLHVIGWWLLPITLFHLIPLLVSALSWRELLPPTTRPDVSIVVRIRWIRESINSLLPVASIGGDFAGMRLSHLRGVPGVQAVASMVVDITIGAATQLILVMSGAALLLTRSSDRTATVVASGVLVGTAVFLVTIAAFTVFQHRGLFGVSAKLTRSLLPREWLSVLEAGASAIDDAVVASYRAGPVILGAGALRLIAWAVEAGEIWLVTRALGRPVDMIDALILESLSSGVRAAAFMLPAGLGALEGGLVMLGALLGLPAEAALAISLTKRIRELALGLPGLFVWHCIEGHHLLRRSEQRREVGDGGPTDGHTQSARVL
jgi:putative membrane protein